MNQTYERRWSERSLRNLKGIHRDLRAVADRALQYSPVDFTVIEGLRDEGRQRLLLQSGASRTLASKHLTGHAIDIAAVVGGQIRWDWPLYPQIAEAFKRAARELGVSLTWGGDWRTLRDGPHFEIDPKRHP